MSISPIITFKAGLCDLNTATDPPKAKPIPGPGYIYLYSEEDLLHFCWRPRSASLDDPKLDLIMFPTDGSFQPYEPTSSQTPSNPKKPTNGRIYVLKFTSSSQRHLFWLQSRSQHQSGDPAWFSARDLKLGQIVNALLQGEEIDVQEAMANLPANSEGPGGDDGDATMEDVEGQNHGPEHHRGGSGGAGPDATGGDIREEGQEAREGGADGGRATTTAPTDASTIIQNFINSMGGGQPTQQEKIFTTLADLLTPASTIPLIGAADEKTIDRMLDYLPPQILSLAQDADGALALTTTGSSPQASRQPSSLDHKRDVLRRVLRSPQFSQSLSSLTIALRDGGLPSISEALNIRIRNGGYMRRGGVPLGGGEAVEAFLDGVKESVQDDKPPEYNEMDTD